MRHMQKQATPPECLANDMWIGYAPCFTAMICFSLELKFGNQFETKVHMQRHRIGARGNVTCFPLPWEKIFRALQEQDDSAGDGRAPQLPHSIADVAGVVRIMLKSSKDRALDLKKVILAVLSRRL